MNGSSQVHSSTTDNLALVICAANAGEVNDWARLNAAWVNPVKHKLFLLSFAEKYGTLAEVVDFDLARIESGGGQEPVLRHFDPLHLIDRQCPIILSGSSWVADDGWAEVVAKANAMMPVYAASGRLIIERKNSDGIVSFRDTAPALIVDDVLRWCFNPRMHGLICKRLPEQFLWCSPLAARLLLANIGLCSSTRLACDQMFGGLSLVSNNSIALYLPDIRVRSGRY